MEEPDTSICQYFMVNKCFFVTKRGNKLIIMSKFHVFDNKKEKIMPKISQGIIYNSKFSMQFFWVNPLSRSR